MPGIGDDFQSAVGQLIAEEFVVPDGGELILSPFFMPSTTGLPQVNPAAGWYRIHTEFFCERFFSLPTHARMNGIQESHEKL